MDKGKLLALAERVSAVSPEEAERDELGAQVLEALEIASYITDDGDPCLSIDGAVAIVPNDYDWAVFHTNGGLTLHAWCGTREDVFGDTPALALCAAALRAQAEALA